jgi:ribosome maturation factor RimP
MEKKLENIVSAMGLDFIEMIVAPGRVLQIFIDNPDGGVSASDCEKVSRQLDKFFAVEGFEYLRLEVSSPGLERQLKKIDDYKKFIGKMIKVTVVDDLKNKKRFESVIEAVDLCEQKISLKSEDGIFVNVPFSQVEKARLVYKS